MFLSGDDDSNGGGSQELVTLDDGESLLFTRVSPCGPGGCSCSPSDPVVYQDTSDPCWYGAILVHQCSSGPQIKFSPQKGLSPTKQSRFGKLLSDPSGLTSSVWVLTMPDGTVYGFPSSFNYSDGGDARASAAIGTFDRNGNSINYNRDGFGNLTEITGSNGRSIQLSYDDQSRVVSAVDNAGRTVSYAYDAQGRLSAFTDAAGFVTRYTYDDNDNMLTVVKPDQKLLVTNTYDGNSRVIQQTFPDGGTYQFSYSLDEAAMSLKPQSLILLARFVRSSLMAMVT